MSPDRESEILGRFRRDIEALVASELKTYTSSLSPAIAPKGPKEFNDPIWGTIILYPAELVVVDSPLLQRLRRIRQLGVAHWVYPGATHSRFEHTLGMVHQVQRLVTAINFRGSPDEVLIPPRIERTLRMTALCHDIGHGLMSHVSERALDNFDVIEDVVLAFVDNQNVERAKLSEIVAFYMIGSPSFRKMLETARNVTEEHLLPPNLADLMQKAVVGKPMTPMADDIPLLHELISGPFDADKLDYMPRDAYMSGVPNVTDISRLIQKIRAIRVTQDELPEEIASQVTIGPASFLIIGIDRSGGSTLDELMIGRTLLFDKIYRHQKVRAAEAMIASMFQLVADLVGPDNPSTLAYALTDDELISLDADRLRDLVPARRQRVALPRFPLPPISLVG